MSKSIKEIAFVVSLGTLLSKFGGMARQLVIAGAFGISAAYDAYNYAYIIPGFFLVPAIIIEILFPLMIIVGYQTRIAAGGLLIFSLLTAFIFHLDFSNQMQVIALLKNIGLAGGMLFLVVHGAKDFSMEKKKKYVRL